MENNYLSQVVERIHFFPFVELISGFALILNSAPLICFFLHVGLYLMDGSFVIYTAVVIPLFKFALLFCLEFLKVVEFWFLSFPFFYKKAL